MENYITCHHCDHVIKKECLRKHLKTYRCKTKLNQINSIKCGCGRYYRNFNSHTQSKYHKKFRDINGPLYS